MNIQSQIEGISAVLLSRGFIFVLTKGSLDVINLVIDYHSQISESAKFKIQKLIEAELKKCLYEYLKTYRLIYSLDYEYDVRFMIDIVSMKITIYKDGYYIASIHPALKDGIISSIVVLKIDNYEETVKPFANSVQAFMYFMEWAYDNFDYEMNEADWQKSSKTFTNNLVHEQANAILSVTRELVFDFGGVN